jgi:hypothetical protein
MRMTTNQCWIYLTFAGECLVTVTVKCIISKIKIMFIVIFAEVQRRIELIQDFEMPICSTSIKASPDGQYVFASGK